MYCFVHQIQHSLWHFRMLYCQRCPSSTARRAPPAPPNTSPSAVASSVVARRSFALSATPASCAARTATTRQRVRDFCRNVLPEFGLKKIVLSPAHRVRSAGRRRTVLPRPASRFSMQRCVSAELPAGLRPAAQVRPADVQVFRQQLPVLAEQLPAPGTG